MRLIPSRPAESTPSPAVHPVLHHADQPMWLQEVVSVASNSKTSDLANTRVCTQYPGGCYTPAAADDVATLA
jgi:hypothetical protein